MRSWLPALLVLLAVSPAGADDNLHYLVEADRALERMDVRVCFTGAPALRLVPGVPATARALVSARDARGAALPISQGAIDTSGLPRGACMRYRIDLDVAVRNAGYGGRFGRDLVMTAGAWLWRPARIARDVHANVRFALPDGIRAAVPWPREAEGYRLGPSAFQRPSFTALGASRPIRVQRAGGHFEIVRVDDEGWALDDAELVRWLERTADSVASVQGRFPVDDTLILLVPGGGTGVGFGMVRRGGGHSVAFMVGKRTADERALLESWVPWHELSHLLLPALPPRDAWFYEGLATYYQEVLRARAGIQPPAAAWSELAAGFDRGADAPVRGTLADASASMSQTRGYMRVYWSGTAFFLEADLAMRARGSSLDLAIARAAPRWRGDPSTWSSERICALWDTPLEAAVLRPLRARYAERRDFPELGPLFDRMGVVRDGGRVVLLEAALSAPRDAIMRGPGAE